MLDQEMMRISTADYNREIEKAYQRGRSDKFSEITKEFRIVTADFLADIQRRERKRGREEAIEELLNALPDCDAVNIEHLITIAERVKRKTRMSDEELKQKLFEVMFVLDDKSAGKDYVALRRQHYSNVEWLHDNGLQEEYYKYFLSQTKGQTNE